MTILFSLSQGQDVRRALSCLIFYVIFFLMGAGDLNSGSLEHLLYNRDLLTESLPMALYFLY